MNSRIVLCCLALCLWVACGKKQEIELNLTSSQQEKLDSLFVKKLESLRPRLNSSCQADLASMRQKLVDSLLQERYAEEQRLREQYRSKTQ